MTRLEQEYRTWADRNSEFREAFYARVRQAVRRRLPFSVSMIVDVMRWYAPRRWEKNGGYKLNDHITAYLARDVIDHIPGAAALITIRRLRSAA